MKAKLSIVAIIFFSMTSAQTRLKTENVIIITLDGMRWQEVFGGADSSFMSQQKNLKDEHLKENFGEKI